MTSLVFATLLSFPQAGLKVHEYHANGVRFGMNASQVIQIAGTPLYKSKNIASELYAFAGYKGWSVGFHKNRVDSITIDSEIPNSNIPWADSPETILVKFGEPEIRTKFASVYTWKYRNGIHISVIDGETSSVRATSRYEEDFEGPDWGLVFKDTIGSLRSSSRDRTQVSRSLIKGVLDNFRTKDVAVTFRCEWRAKSKKSELLDVFDSEPITVRAESSQVVELTGGPFVATKGYDQVYTVNIVSVESK